MADKGNKENDDSFPKVHRQISDSARNSNNHDTLTNHSVPSDVLAPSPASLSSNDGDGTRPTSASNLAGTSGNLAATCGESAYDGNQHNNDGYNKQPASSSQKPELSQDKYKAECGPTEAISDNVAKGGSKNSDHVSRPAGVRTSDQEEDSSDDKPDIYEGNFVSEAVSDNVAKDGSKNTDFGSGPAEAVSDNVAKGGSKNTDFGSGPAEAIPDNVAKDGSKNSDQVSTPAVETSALPENVITRPKEPTTGYRNDGHYMTQLLKDIKVVIYIQTPKFKNDCVLLPIEAYKMSTIQFLMTEKKWIKQQMKQTFGNGTKVKILPNQLSVIVESTSEEDCKHIDWKATNVFKGFEKYILSNEIVIDCNNLKKILNAVCTEVIPNINNKRVNIYHEENKIIVVGFQPEYESVYREVVEVIDKHKNKRRPWKIPFEHCSPECFEQLNLCQVLNIQYPTVKLKVDHQSNVIKFSGNKDDVAQCITNFRSLEKKVQSSTQNFPEHFIQLLKTSETKEYVYKVLKSSACHLEVDTTTCTVRAFAMSKELADKVLKSIEECFCEHRYSATNLIYQTVIKEQEWLQFISDYKDRKLLEFGDDDYLRFFGTKDVITELMELAVKLSKSEWKHKQSVKKSCAPIVKSKETKIPGAMHYLLKENTSWAMDVKAAVMKIQGAELKTGNSESCLLVTAAEEELDNLCSEGMKLIENVQVKKTFPINKQFHSLINKPDVGNYIEGLLKKHDLYVFMHTNNDEKEYYIIIIGINEPTVNKSWKIIEQSLLGLSYSVLVDKTLYTRLRSLEERFSAKGLLEGNEIKSESIEMWSTDDIHEAFNKEILEIIEKKQLQKIILYSRKEKIDFIEPLLQEIEKKCDVPLQSIRLNPDFSVIEIEGTQSSNDRVATELNYVLNTVVISCVRLEGKESKHLQIYNEQIKNSKCLVSNVDRQCYTACCFVETEKKVQIEIVCGRATDIEVDVIVCPTNECLIPIGCMGDALKDDKELQTMAQQYLAQNKVVLDVGEILFLDANSSLMCHTVAMCVLVNSHSKVNPILAIKPVLTKLVEHCSISGVQSIAIPVQIFENLPVKHQVEALFTCITSTISTLKCVKEVYICVLGQSHLNDCCKEAVSYFHPKYEKFDFCCMHLRRDVPIDEKSSISVRVKKGLLVDHKADILVNTVGTHLNLEHGYVSKSILRKAGTIIQHECLKARPDGIKIGQVIATSSGNLRTCKKICHGALPEWLPRSGLSLKVLKLFVWRCLLEAHQNGYQTVAFPALGTGKLNYPHHAVAETMFEAIENFGIQLVGTTIRQVDIVLFPDDPQSVWVFEAVEKRRQKLQPVRLDELYESCRILEWRFPSDFGGLCVQVLPIDPKAKISEQIAVKFVKKLNAPEGYETVQEGDGYVLTARINVDLKKVIKESLFCSHKYRLTSVAFILEEKPLENLQQEIKTIKDVAISEKDNPYLQIVRIYIKNETLFEDLEKATFEDKKKSLGSNKIAVSKTLVNRQKNFVPNCKSVYLHSKEKQQYVVIVGRGDDVVITKKMIMDILREIHPKQVWYYIDETKNRIQFESFICDRLNTELLEFRGEKVKIKDEENQAWEFNLKKMECKRDSQVYKLHFQVIKESSVDPLKVGLPSAYSGTTPKEEPFVALEFTINPKLNMPQYKSRLTNLLGKHTVQFNKETMVVTGTFDQMESVNKDIISEFGVEGGLFVAENKRKHSQRKANSASQAHTGFENIFRFRLTDIEYQMMKFFCPDCQIFKGEGEHFDGEMLTKILQSGETDEGLTSTVQSKLTFFNSMTSVEIMSPKGTLIDDGKLQEIIQNISAISSEIFCYRSKDQTMLILKGSHYEKLQTAKTKAEFILGIQKLGKGGRKDRVIATDAIYKGEQDETKNIKAFHQSITTPKTSFSQSFGGHSTSPTSLTFPEIVYKTAEGLIIKVYVGNILNLNVDCIVNAANETLSHGGGVAEAISRAAGYKFQDESDDYIKRNGPLKVSECCTTSAGNLKYKCVIHAVGPRWYDYPTDKKALCAYDLQQTIFKCLKEAENQNCVSVALPAISSAIFGVPKDVCSPQYRRAVLEYSTKCGMTTCLKEIHFMDKDRDMISKIQAEFSQYLNIDQSAQSVANANMASNSPASGALSRIENGQLMRSLSSDPDLNKDKKQSVNNATFKESAQFQKQFIAEKGLKVCIVQEDITKMNVDIIVCPQDDLCRSKGMIAKAIEDVSNETYKNDVIRMKMINRCEVRKVLASPSSLPFKAVLHTVAPRWDKTAVKDNAKFMKELGLTIRNIIRHCSDSNAVSTVAIPLLGVGADGHDTPCETYASILAREISNELKSDRFRMQEIYIVTHEWSMASLVADQFDKEAGFKVLTSFQRQRRHQNKDENESKDNTRNRGSTSSEMALGTAHGESKLGTTVRGGHLDNCVICMDTPTDPRKLQCGHIFCQECIKQHFKINNPVCPTCGSIQGVLTGNQPPGTMKITRRDIPLAGYLDYGRIEIEYDIFSGKQGPEHKTPGRWFEGIKRVGYLPDNAKGQLVAKMLKVAFERKLVFTIGDSRTTGKQGVVTWNDIHHKTNPKPNSEFGYPDASYLDRVIDELSVKGITEKDVGHIRL